MNFAGVMYFGRMGNQLFQFYFFLYLKSLKTKKNVFLTDPRGAYICKYFDLGDYNYVGSTPYWLLCKIIMKLFTFKIVYIHNFFKPKHPKIDDGNIIFHGFYQTDWYINQIENLPKIKIKQFYINRFNEKYGSLFNNGKTIAIHIRRTDYINYGKRDISLPIDYFRRRLAEIDNIDSYTVIFCSDDIEYVKTQFPGKPNYVFSEEDEITDFQILMNADIAIISNSSFAWWAAYLSTKDNRVIAPENWMGFRLNREHPRGIMTDRFEWYKVEAIG